MAQAIQTKIFPLTMSTLTAGPRFNTDITVGRNGQEVRNALWQDALWKFNAAYGVRTRTDVDTLLAFFLNCYGKEKSFLLQSADDYSIPQLPDTTFQNIGTGDGSTTQFQIVKKYTDSGGNVFTRNIYRPSTTAADLVVKKNGVTQTITTHYTYSTTTGIITFVTPPTTGHAITITLAKFYFIVRFDIDELPIEALTWWSGLSSEDKSLHQIPNIPLVEVRDLT